jgi:hypothetical protein
MPCLFEGGRDVTKISGADSRCGKRAAWDRAEALAQFAKRAIFDTFLDRAINEDEAYAMRDALNAVREALAAAGFAPR